MCFFLPVCSVHQSPVPRLDKQALVRHGFHSVADSCQSSALAGGENETGTACLPDPLTLVSLLVDWSSLSPVSACRMCCLPDVEVAGAPVAELS